MNKSFGLNIRDVFKRIWQDIIDYKWIGIVLAVYFLTIRIFFEVSCILVQITGFPCPACGLTRAFLDVVRGDFSQAWRTHLFVYPILLLIIVACFRRYILKISNTILKGWVIVLILCMLVYYIYRMVLFFPGEPPISFYSGNWMHKIFMLVRP